MLETVDCCYCKFKAMKINNNKDKEIKPYAHIL